MIYTRGMPYIFLCDPFFLKSIREKFTVQIVKIYRKEVKNLETQSAMLAIGCEKTNIPGTISASQNPVFR
jgi:hypothetical protein